MTFREAVEKTPGLEAAYKAGLQALKAIDRKRISAANTRNLTGSVDIDSALQSKFPHDSRWDYSIGIKRDVGSEEAIWIEVHPATVGEVKVVIRKYSWLSEWLKGAGTKLNSINSGEYYWIASGKVNIPSGTPEYRRLAASGIIFIGRSLSL